VDQKTTAPRPYQATAISGVRWEWDRGVDSVILQLPTGGGKTHTAAAFIAAETGPVVFAAHLDALVGDTAARLRSAGVSCGIVAPWAKAQPEERVQVVSLGTAHARRLAPPAVLIIVDECHRAMARTVRSWLERYQKGVRLLGLTATPERGDGQPLGDLFESVVQGPSVASLMADGFLCGYTLKCPGANRQGDGVRELAKHREEWTRALYFAETIDAGVAAARRLNEAGLPAACLFGDTPRRVREAFRGALRSGELRALVGVGVFVEGFDEPSVDAVVLDAAFGTVGRYLQAIGRGLRPSPRKTGLLILDVRGAVHMHGLPDEGRTWNLSGTASTRNEPGMRIATCQKCLAVYKAGPSACPRCGASAEAAVVYEREPTHTEKLVEYAKIPREQRIARYRAAMIRLATSRFRMDVKSAERYATKETEKRFPCPQ